MISRCGGQLIGPFAILSVLLIVALVCIVPSPHVSHGVNGHNLRRSLAQVFNSTGPTATYLYIVGVEGVGHHGVSPAIASIAQSCQQHVIYEHNALRTLFTHMSSLKFRTALVQLANFVSPKSILYIEGSSFPTSRVHRYSPDHAKREFGLYNINWLYNQAKLANINIKFFHLTRDFYRTVASHPEFDGTFENHAQVLYNFTQYIDSEFRSIEAKEPGLWRQIKYEWFTEMDNCSALVSAVVDFMGWTECNLARACAILHEDLRPPTRRAVNETEYEYAQQFDVSVPTPLLNISALNNYSFVNNIHLPEPVVNNKNRKSLPRWQPDTTAVLHRPSAVTSTKVGTPREIKSPTMNVTVVQSSTTRTVYKKPTAVHRRPLNMSLTNTVTSTKAGASRIYKSLNVTNVQSDTVYKKPNTVYRRPGNVTVAKRSQIPYQHRDSPGPQKTLEATDAVRDGRTTALHQRLPPQMIATAVPRTPVPLRASAVHAVTNRERSPHRPEARSERRPEVWQHRRQPIV